MYRQGVSALIMNDKKEFLIVNLISFAEHFYAIPGGGVEDGETHRESVYREIKEELGIDKDLLDFMGEDMDSIKVIYTTPKIKNGIEYIGMERFFFGFVFKGNDNDIVLQPEEIRAYKWSSIEDLDKYLLFGSQASDSITKINNIFKLN